MARARWGDSLHPRPYRGAGILFACREAAGWRVLLGRRATRPGRGKWSVPGGTMDPVDGGDFWVTAMRETAEELAAADFRSLVEAWWGAAAFKAIAAGNHPHTVLRLPFFTYLTYLVVVPALPPTAPRSNWEFSAVAWSPLAALPRGLVAPLGWSLWRFRRRGLLRE